MQMRHPRALALAGAMAVTVFTACKEPPFAPRWDADMYMPLSFQSIPVQAGSVPNGVSAPDSFPTPLSQDLSGVLGNVMKNLVTDPARCTAPAPASPALSCDLITVTLRKTLALTVQDTLFIGNAANALNAAGAAGGTVVFPIGLSGAQSSMTDSLYLAPASVAMLQAAGSGGSQVWIQVRGTLSNQSGGTITATAADSIGITSLTATMRIAVSHK
jgi:hypothetical protein